MSRQGGKELRGSKNKDLVIGQGDRASVDDSRRIRKTEEWRWGRSSQEGSGETLMQNSSVTLECPEVKEKFRLIQSEKVSRKKITKYTVAGMLK